jgi:hypothetical protein
MLQTQVNVFTLVLQHRVRVQQPVIGDMVLGGSSDE